MDATPDTLHEVRVGAEVRKSSIVSGKSSDNKPGFAVSTGDEEATLRQRGHVTFDDAGLEQHYKPLDTYEGAHRYDPDFQWEPEEEKKLVRKIDWRICSFVCLTFFALQLDRGNIVQAVADDMLEDLGLSTNDYNNGQTIFFLSFLVAELPSQLISKKIGPDNWVPIQMVAWSTVASFQAFLSGKTSFFITRALIGLIEGGFIPDNILYLSYWYTSTELPTRLSWFWVAYQSTSIISAFLAFGILHMDGVNGLEGWRWLFALEGILTGLIGIVAFFYMAPSPTQTASWFRGKNGWFSEREEKILVNRILRDDPSKGDMHNRQAITPSMFWRCLKDYDLWPVFLLGLTWLTPTKPLEQYLTLILRDAGFSTFETNLLTIPAYALFIINLLFWTWLSEKINERLLLCLAAPLWNLPVLIALEVIPGDSNKWVKWALATLVVGSPYVHAILVAITSRNAGSVRTRTVATALYNMSIQAGSIIGTQIYRENDAPMYRTGNKVLLGLICWNTVLFIFTKFYYVKKNKHREQIWNEMTSEEKDEYLETTKDRGNKRIDFRFAH